MEVRAADAGLGHPQQYGARLDLRHVIFLDLEGFPILLTHDNASFHGVLPYQKDGCQAYTAMQVQDTHIATT
jgi:hypothetical protein